MSAQISGADGAWTWAANEGPRRSLRPVRGRGGFRQGKGPATAQGTGIMGRREGSGRGIRRVTRALVLLAAVPLLALLLSLMLRVTATPPAPAPIEWVVRPGDTLWNIAVVYTEPGEDIRATLWEIQEQNGLAGGHIVPGQVIQIPAHLAGD